MLCSNILSSRKLSNAATIQHTLLWLDTTHGRNEKRASSAHIFLTNGNCAPGSGCIKVLVTTKNTYDNFFSFIPLDFLHFNRKGEQKPGEREREGEREEKTRSKWDNHDAYRGFDSTHECPIRHSIQFELCALLWQRHRKSLRKRIEWRKAHKHDVTSIWSKKTV